MTAAFIGVYDWDAFDIFHEFLTAFKEDKRSHGDLKTNQI